MVNHERITRQANITVTTQIRRKSKSHSSRLNFNSEATRASGLLLRLLRLSQVTDRLMLSRAVNRSKVKNLSKTQRRLKAAAFSYKTWCGRLIQRTVSIKILEGLHYGSNNFCRAKPTFRQKQESMRRHHRPLKPLTIKNLRKSMMLCRVRIAHLINNEI